jgi:hypothetical protein
MGDGERGRNATCEHRGNQRNQNGKRHLPRSRLILESNARPNFGFTIRYHYFTGCLEIVSLPWLG